MKKLCVLDKGIYTFYSDIAAETVYEHYFDRQDEYSCFNEKLETLKQLSGKSSPRLLDVGCGPGFFLYAALQKGFTVHGLDVSKKAVEYAEKMFNIHVSSKDMREFHSEERFDIIHMKTFLEHVSEPLQYIESAYEMLEDGGILYIEGPNDFNVLQKCAARLLNVSKWWINFPHHLSYITFNAMKKTLIHNRFSICRTEMSFPVELFLFFGVNYISYPEKGKYVGALLHFITRSRNSSALFRIICSAARKMLSFIGIGRRYIFYVRKECK